MDAVMCKGILIMVPSYHLWRMQEFTAKALMSSGNIDPVDRGPLPTGLLLRSAAELDRRFIISMSFEGGCHRVVGNIARYLQYLPPRKGRGSIGGLELLE